MGKTRTAHLLLLAIMASSSCSKDYTSDDTVIRTEEKTCTVEISVIPEGMENDTRSSFTWTDSEFKDVQVVVTDEKGLIQEVIRQNSEGSFRFTGMVGRKYLFHAGVNLGYDISTSGITNLNSLSLSVDYDRIAADGMPMFSDSGVSLTMDSSSPEVVIPVRRMMARVDLVVDPSRLGHADSNGGFTVKSVSIFNAINRYSPLAENRSSKVDGSLNYSFDHASSEDISTLNSGGKISLYAFENLQGTSLPYNNDPWKKVPASIDGGELCSYIEVKASYRAQGLSTEDITYRMYLGDDATTNFDVRRNTVYTISLKPTEEEIDGHRGSWKIMSRNWIDNRSITMLPPSITVPSLSHTSTMVIMAPSDFEYVVSGYDWLSSAGCTLSNDVSSRRITITNISPVESDRHGTIRVSSWDGSVSADVGVTVNMTNRETGREILFGEILGFELSPVSDIPASGGQSEKVTISNVTQESWERIHYLDGTQSETEKRSVQISDFSSRFSKTPSGSYSQDCPTYNGSNLGTSASERKSLGKIHAYVIANGKTSEISSVEVFQQENKVEYSDLTSTTPLGISYGSKEYYRYGTETRGFYMNASAEGYDSSTAPAPASGGQTTVHIDTGHEERSVNMYSRTWTQDIRKTYRDTFTSGAEAYRNVVEHSDSGTEYGEDCSGWEAVSDLYSTSGGASGFSISGSSVQVQSLGTSVSGGRQCTYTFSNSNDSGTRAYVTIYQGANSVEQTVPAHYEHSDYRMALSDYTVPGNGYHLVSIGGSVTIRSISEMKIYTSGAVSGGETTASWSTSSAVWPEQISSSPSSGLNFGTTTNEGQTVYYTLNADENPSHSPRSWTITGTYKGMTSSVTLTQEGSATPTLSVDSESIDTWGGNSYPLHFTYTNGTGQTTTVTPVLESVSYTGGAPSGLISYSGGALTAADWWGAHGSWVTGSPSYTATFSYGGAKAYVSGTMNGTTGFAGMDAGDIVFTQDHGLPDGSGARLVGSTTINVGSSTSCSVNAGYGSYSGGHLMVGSYTLNYSTVDPTNGLTRTGSTSFNVLTNVASVEGSISISNPSYSTGNIRTVYGSTGTNGGELATVTIYTNGHDETRFTISTSLTYTDVWGGKHSATAPANSPDYGSLPSASSPGGVEPTDYFEEVYSINGFAFKIIWRAD